MLSRINPDITIIDDVSNYQIFKEAKEIGFFAFVRLYFMFKVSSYFDCRRSVCQSKNLTGDRNILNSLKVQNKLRDNIILNLMSDEFFLLLKDRTQGFCNVVEYMINLAVYVSVCRKSQSFISYKEFKNPLKMRIHYH